MSTARSVGLQATGANGPALTGPLAVLMKRLTTEPAVKFRPFMSKLPPTTIIDGILLMKGWPGTGVGVEVAVGVGVDVGGGRGVGGGGGVGVGLASGVGVGVGVGLVNFHTPRPWVAATTVPAAGRSR